MWLCDSLLPATDVSKLTPRAESSPCFAETCSSFVCLLVQSTSGTLTMHSDN